MKVESSSLCIVVGVLGWLQTGSLDDVNVVAPSGFWNIDVCGNEGSNELKSDPQGPGSGDALGSDNALFLHEWVFLTENELLGKSIEVGKTVDREVLLVNCQVIHDFLLSLPYDFKDVGLGLVCPIGSDTNIDLGSGSAL